MIRAVIIDDEPKAIQALQWELEHFKKEITVVKTFSNSQKAVHFLIENTDIDAIFLDINMPLTDGFSLLEKIGKVAENFSIVITTAHQEHAIQAIKNNVVDYLLKPVDEEDLRIAIDKITQYLTRENVEEKFDQLLTEFHKTVNHKKISINTDGKTVFIDPSKITHAESDGNYTTVYFDSQDKMVLTKKLKEFGKMLDRHVFFRVHHSYIVNLSKIKEYYKTDGYIVLDNGQEIPVSRSKKSDFIDKI